MTTPHKHAEVIKAWADGKGIQNAHIHSDKWYNWIQEEAGIGIVPEFNDISLQWRIKPEVKTGWIAISKKQNVAFSDVSAAQALDNHDTLYPVTDSAIACIQITYTEGEGL